MSNEKTHAESAALEALLSLPTNNDQIHDYYIRLAGAIKNLQQEKRHPKFREGNRVDVLDWVGPNGVGDVVYSDCVIMKVCPKDDLGIRRYLLEVPVGEDRFRFLHLHYNEESLRLAVK